MSKAINAALIEGLEAEIKAVDSCVLIGTVGMNVAEVSALRGKLRGHAFRMRVVKNALARRSFDRHGWRDLGDRLSGPSAVVFGGEGAIAIAKVLVDEKRTHKAKLLIHGAWCEGEVLDQAGVEALSKVPGRKELLGMCLAGLFGPVSGMAGNLEGLLQEMQGLVEALGKQREPAEAPAA